jgi:hypothetical protein
LADGVGVGCALTAAARSPKSSPAGTAADAGLLGATGFGVIDCDATEGADGAPDGAGAGGT